MEGLSGAHGVGVPLNKHGGAVDDSVVGISKLTLDVDTRTSHSAKGSHDIGATSTGILKHVDSRHGGGDAVRAKEERHKGSENHDC